MRKLHLLLHAFLSLALIGASPLQPAKGLYVSDPVSCIYREHRDFILDCSREFYEKTGVQVLVIAINDLSGLSEQAYSDEILSGWRFTGHIGENAALILLSVPGERIHISLTGECAIKLSLEDVSDAYDTAALYLASSSYSNAVLEAYKYILLSMYRQYGIEPDQKLAGKLVQGNDTNQSNAMYYSLVFIVAAIFIGLRGFSVSRKYQKKFAGRRYYKRKNYVFKRRAFDEDENKAIIDLPYNDDNEG